VSLAQQTNRIVNRTQKVLDGNVHYAARPIVGKEYAAVFGNRNADGTTSHLSIFRYEACEEALVASIGMAIMHRDRNHVVSGAVFAVPRAMVGGKGVAVVTRRELALTLNAMLANAPEDPLQRFNRLAFRRLVGGLAS
jgi:hypothetical protein